jgi:hypothetical protein
MDLHKQVSELRLMKWRATYHGEVPNKTAPGGAVDMWLLVDDETGDSIVSLGVPKGRSDIAGYIVMCCGNPVRWVTSMRKPDLAKQGVIDPEGALAKETKVIADALFAALMEQHPGDRQVNGWTLNDALAQLWFAFCGQLSHKQRGELLFEFLQIATTDYDQLKAEDSRDAERG